MHHMLHHAVGNAHVEIDGSTVGMWCNFAPHISGD